MLITLARKPLNGATVVQCCLQHGCGALNIDASRIGTGTGEVTTVTVPDHRSGNFGQDTQAYKDRPKLTVQRVDQGRWPANVLNDGSEAVLAVFPQTTVGQIVPYRPAETRGVYGADSKKGYLTKASDKNSGSAARYFKRVG